jgi:hypothetical protein
MHLDYNRFTYFDAARDSNPPRIIEAKRPKEINTSKWKSKKCASRRRVFGFPRFYCGVSLEDMNSGGLIADEKQNRDPIR